MTSSFDARYHVPRSQVWGGSRGGQSGCVHLHVCEQFDIGRIHRKSGQALCGKRGWMERPPMDGERTCPRCLEIAARIAGSTPRPELYSSAADGVGREGMVTVWDENGLYLGCMGLETWYRLPRESARAE